jgi:hypothetical protein
MACAKLTREEKRKEYKYDFTKAQDTWQELVHDVMGYGIPYFDYTINTAEIESDLHDTWDSFIYAAKVLPSTSSEHDRLVTLILNARELGQFTRKNERGIEEARLSNGQRLWTDLPYLAQDLQAFWMDESMSLTPTERKSLSVFTAKSCASGICSADLALCALWLFKEALETERPVSNPSAENPPSNDTLADSQVSISDLVPALVQWMKHSNHKLASLCAGSSGSPGTAIHNSSKTSPGPLARRAQIAQEGFSLERWLFWRQRLGDLYLTGDEAVAKPARECFEIMALTGLRVGISIPGEKRYLEKLFEALDKELIRRGSKGCVSPEDIEINPAWATED